MDNQLYAKFKLTLLKYDFAKSSTFAELRHFAKAHGVTGIGVKRFIKIAQDMGVASVVRRTDEGVKRSLTYDPSNDLYIGGEIMGLAKCDHCKGTGVVEVPITGVT